MTGRKKEENKSGGCWLRSAGRRGISYKLLLASWQCRVDGTDKLGGGGVGGDIILHLVVGRSHLSGGEQLLFWPDMEDKRERAILRLFCCRLS